MSDDQQKWIFTPETGGKPNLHIHTGADEWNKASKLNTLTISQNGVNVVSIHTDGSIDVNPKYSHTEAAKAFWDAVRQIGVNHGW